MAKQEKAKNAGRPTRREGERLSKNRTFRVRPQLDEQLTNAAGSSGRSVSEEIELRLEQSFTKQQTMLESLDYIFGRETAALSMIFAELGKRINLSAPALAVARGKSSPGKACWIDDPFLFNEFSSAVGLLLKELRPPGDGEVIPVPEPLSQAGASKAWEGMLSNVGARTVGEIFELPAIAPALDRTGWAVLIRDRLSADFKARLLTTDGE